MIEENEEKLLRSVALQTASTILRARERAEHELKQAKKELEEKARKLDHSLSILRATIEIYRRRNPGYRRGRRGTSLQRTLSGDVANSQRGHKFKRTPATDEILLQVLEGPPAVPG